MKDTTAGQLVDPAAQTLELARKGLHLPAEPSRQ